MPQSDQAWNEQNIQDFRANNGKVASFVQINAGVVLLHTRGARSGKEYITPLVYFLRQQRLFIFASDFGGLHHPSWHHNLVAHPHVFVEMGTETYAAQAVVVQGQERDEIFQSWCEKFPVFLEYQEKAGSRMIPVIELVIK